jgi:hypothetical protein
MIASPCQILQATEGARAPEQSGRQRALFVLIKNRDVEIRRVRRCPIGAGRGRRHLSYPRLPSQDLWAGTFLDHSLAELQGSGVILCGGGRGLAGVAARAVFGSLTFLRISRRRALRFLSSCMPPRAATLTRARLRPPIAGHTIAEGLVIFLRSADIGQRPFWFALGEKSRARFELGGSGKSIFAIVAPSSRPRRCARQPAPCHHHVAAPPTPLVSIV